MIFALMQQTPGRCLQLHVCHAFISVDTQFRMSILERLEQMEQRMAEISNQNPNSETMATKGGGVDGGGATDQQSQVRQEEVIQLG